MKTFLLILVLAVLAAVAIRVWLVDADHAIQLAETGVATKQVGQDQNVKNDGNNKDSTDKSPAEIVTRSPSTDQSGATQQEEDDIPLVYWSDFGGLWDMIEFVGLEPEQYMNDAESWFRERGTNMRLSPYGAPTIPLQPYDQYDEETLMSFAASGDPWAQQTLGRRWQQSRPADAIDMLRRAAEQGSTTAMGQLAYFYKTAEKLDDLSEQYSGDALNQIQAILDSTPDLELESARWNGAVEIITGGMFPGPDHGYLTPGIRASAETSPERQKEVCDAALQTYQDLRDSRAANGKPPIQITAPPFFNPDMASGYCDSPEWPRPDTSHCRMLRIAEPEQNTTHLLGFCPKS